MESIWWDFHTTRWFFPGNTCVVSVLHACVYALAEITFTLATCHRKEGEIFCELKVVGTSAKQRQCQYMKSEALKCIKTKVINRAPNLHAHTHMPTHMHTHVAQSTTLNNPLPVLEHNVLGKALVGSLAVLSGRCSREHDVCHLHYHAAYTQSPTRVSVGYDLASDPIYLQPKPRSPFHWNWDMS